MSNDNVCEHGDHPAPEGMRFCGKGCAVCEHDSNGQEGGCAGLCTLYEEGIAQGRALERWAIIKGLKEKAGWYQQVAANLEGVGADGARANAKYAEGVLLMEIAEIERGEHVP